MAHEITSTDGFFAVREPGWHKLGVTLPEYPTREEAQSIAHPWEPVSEPIFTAEPSIEDDGTGFGPQLSTKYTETPGYKAIRRSDNGDTLGVVSDGYVAVDNNELWDIAEALQGSDKAEVRFETAGSLQGGKRVWILIRLNEPLEIAGDPNGATVPYYALQNSHDGSGSLRGQATMVRVVCANTSKVADLDSKARGTEFTFRHSKNIGERIDQAKAALTGWRESIQEWQAFSEHLMTLKVTAGDRIAFVERFIPEPAGQIISDRVRGNIDAERKKMYGILASPTSAGINLNAYGLVNAAIEYAEHGRRAHTAESRFTRSYLERSKLVSLATDLALEVAR